MATAYKESQEIRGEGEAKALEIYANAFNKDPDFYEFTRTLEAYETSLDEKTILVQPADTDFFRFLKGR
ncbi:MAG TPA: hypothetical protein DIC52_07705 [Candidatus Latescibacteria bacterium]|nr:hypothetical protein [Candidatus Latescibacterota bacterium]